MEKHLENIVRGGKKRGKLLCGNEVREIRVVGPDAGSRAAARNLQLPYTRTISIKHGGGIKNAARENANFYRLCGRLSPGEEVDRMIKWKMFLLSIFHIRPLRRYLSFVRSQLLLFE